MSLLALAAVPAAAFAAAKHGTYSGTSSGKYIQVGQAEEPTDRGRVSFGVKSTLRLTIKVTSAGKATGTVHRPASVMGLCSTDHPVRFSAKRR